MANLECPICLEEIKVDNIQETRCLHIFHQNCLQNWQKKSNKCPLCRKNLIKFEFNESIIEEIEKLKKLTDFPIGFNDIFTIEI